MNNFISLQYLIYLYIYLFTCSLHSLKTNYKGNTSEGNEQIKYHLDGDDDGVIVVVMKMIIVVKIIIIILIIQSC
jgi:hypothetical protein